MTTLHKSYPIAQFKALPSEGEGTFEAIVSVIGNVDLQGDRVVSGAYDKSIESWQKSGNPMPVLWSHDWGDPFAHIGYVNPNDMREVPAKGNTPGGLYVKGQLDVHKPFAKQVYDLLAERRVTEWSFSYDIPPGGEKRAKDGANELLEVGLIEIGPTLKGANSATVTIGTKSFDVNTDESRQMKLRLARAETAQLEVELAKAEWSGDRAMGMCSSAADFAKIAFERANDSDPATAAHWALPHHMGPNADANPAGVSAALGALNGARGGAPDLKDKAAAQKHLEAHQAAESKAFDPSQHRGPNGEWATGGGGDGGNAPSGGTAPGGADRKHTAENDAKHPLGEGTLNDLRVALNRAGMPKNDILALVQKMRDDFHQTGKINIPKEADKVLGNDERAKLGDAIRTEAEKRGWDPKTGEWNPKKSATALMHELAKAAGDPSHLISWYNDGADGQIGWGSPGDWQQCVDVASKYMDADQAKGFCELRHQDATGMSTAEHAHNEGKAFDPSQERDDHGRWTSGGGGGDSGGGDSGVLPGTSITADDARAAAAAERTRTEGQDYGGADASVIVGPDGSVVDASSDYYWVKESWRAAPEGSVLVEPDGTVTEGNGTTHPPKKSEGRSMDAVFEKAGRMIGADAAQTIKEHVMSALDECFAMMNGDNTQYTEGKSGDAKDYAKGYGDGSANREPTSDLTEYKRGYEEGQKDRGAMEISEVADFNKLLDGLVAKH